jgi:protein dithiol oxidoreductase (disulfide-forming)
MKRRELPLHLAGLVGLFSTGGLAVIAPTTAKAQATQVAGKEFMTLQPPVPVARTGKIEVLEFFWYGCPHCNAFEPSLEAWVKRLPADVHFSRVHVGFSPMHQYHQRIYYALEVLGKLDAVHSKVFEAIHVQHKRLLQDAEVSAFMSAQGLDGGKFVETMKSFAVAGKCRQGDQLVKDYRIDGVPTLGIHGRYTTSPSMAGSHERTLAVADSLIARVRKNPG